MERPINGPIYPYTLRRLALPGSNREGLIYAEPTLDLLPSSVEGSSGTGQSQPKTIREDAVNSPGANPIQEMLIINNISCDDAMKTTFVDVKDSHSTVQRNPN